MRTIFAPNKLDIKKNEKSFFCAGSIELNTAEDWQAELIDK